MVHQSFRAIIRVMADIVSMDFTLTHTGSNSSPNQANSL